MDKKGKDESSDAGDRDVARKKATESGDLADGGRDIDVEGIAEAATTRLSS